MEGIKQFEAMPYKIGREKFFVDIVCRYSASAGAVVRGKSLNVDIVHSSFRKEISGQNEEATNQLIVKVGDISTLCTHRTLII